MTCDDCGRELMVGDWPFCPHGRGGQNVITDDVPGGFTVENGFDEPTTFYSKSAHVAALKARGCVINAKWAGPHDKHLKRWDAPTAKSLEDARVLLERGPQAVRERRETFPGADVPIVTSTPGGTFHVKQEY